MGDMERKITLMVFVLSSVLVLAGFSANQNVFAAPTGTITDDLHCYTLNIGADLGVQMLLSDQFFTDAPHDLLHWDEICNPVLKQPASFPPSVPLNEYHWTTWTMTTVTQPQVIASVNIVDQFHPGGFDVGVTDFAEILMVPADKDHNGIFPNPTDAHYKCYELDSSADSINDIVQLSDQFGDSTYTELVPVEICNPVEKKIESIPGSGNFDLSFGLPLGDEHYLCYELFPPSPVTPETFTAHDQFASFISNTLGDSVLCTIAQKIVNPDISVGGTNIPINTSSLLLAGAASVSMWMIPVVVAGAGIGVFVISRRK